MQLNFSIWDALNWILSQVGDVIRMENNSFIAADILLLSRFTVQKNVSDINNSTVSAVTTLTACVTSKLLSWMGKIQNLLVFCD